MSDDDSDLPFFLPVSSTNQSWAHSLLSAVKRFDEDYKAFNVRLPIYEKNIRPKVVGDASLEKYERILKEI